MSRKNKDTRLERSPSVPGVFRLAHAGLVNLLCFSPLLAIPSPDLVINFFANAAQVLGLLTVLLGGALFSSRRRPASAALSVRSESRLRWPFRIATTLLLVSVAANVLQYARRADERARRLQANLTRSSKENGERVGDVSLKTLDFSAQNEHPRGITTPELASLMESRPESLNLVDIRETEEAELGKLEGAWHIRYPDLREQPELAAVEGKETVLLCYSGNRSSELSDEFARDEGLACRFLIGGYEKWIAEGRPLDAAGERRRRELRDLPDFPGKDRLLDTPEVERLVADRGAVFVDVRYPGDFDLSHLPGAINVPLRKMTTPEVEAKLNALPGKPVIAPCYDKRSSFYALILGARLHDMNREFLGRYTVPHEYSVAGQARPHVERWNELRSRGVYAALTSPLEELLRFFHRRSGHLALAIVICVILLRLAILPVTLKGERDQHVLRELAPEVARIKGETDGDPSRSARAILALYRRHSLRPGLNMIGTVAQVFLFVLFFGAVSAVAKSAADSGLWWMSSLSHPDPLMVLPATLGLLVWAHLKANAARSGTIREALRLLGAGALATITLPLSAAVNLYLVTNVFLMFLQNRLVAARLGRRARPRELGAPPPTEGGRATPITALDRARWVPGCGNKAARLAEMRAAGLPVPDGFVLTDALVSHGNGVFEIPPSAQRSILRHWRRLGAERVAVRSSGLNEDGTSQSYAGVFESVLNVSRESIFEALAEVRASLHSERASAYSGNGSERGGILVQEMVPAEHAGVLFTEHPSETGTMLVELVNGLGEALVNGSATPQSFRFGRHTGRLLDTSEPPIDLGELVRLGRRVEKLFGKPQDIEWAFCDGRFRILQSRDITTSSSSSGSRLNRIFESERKRVLEIASRSAPASGADENDVVFYQNELSELLPRPTPLSLSLMDSLWAAGGSTDLACRMLGVPYDVEEESPPLTVSVFGALYINRPEEVRRLGRGPGMVASFRLARSADDLERGFRQRFLPPFLKRVKRNRAIDLSKLDLGELLDLFEDWRRAFVTETYVEAELINVASDFYVKVADKELARRGLSVGTCLSHAPQTVVHRAMSLLPEIQSGRRPVAHFLDLFGHRATHDYELAAPRYAEDPTRVVELASRAGRTSSAHPATTNASSSPGEKGVLGLAIERARRFQSLKEEAKHHALRELALLRKVLVEIDRRLGFEGGIFYLTLEELRGLDDPAVLDEAGRNIEIRQAESSYFATLELPARLRLEKLEALTPAGLPGRRERASRTAKTLITGTHVAGERSAAGRARVITSAADLDSFRDGEILVARFTDPEWTPLFPRAAGVLTEVGGRLSHAAIVAREYNVTAIVGAEGVLDEVRTGDLLVLHLDGTVEVVEDRRHSRRKTVEIRVSLLKQDEVLEALVVNLSREGALVRTDRELRPGEAVKLRGKGIGPVDAKVVREAFAGGYGMRLSKSVGRLSS